MVKHQHGLPPEEEEHGLIVGDAKPLPPPMLQLSPLELDSKEEEGYGAPDPTMELRRPTPARQGESSALQLILLPILQAPAPRLSLLQMASPSARASVWARKEGSNLNGAEPEESAREKGKVNGYLDGCLMHGMAREFYTSTHPCTSEGTLGIYTNSASAC
jgi:hypothetical protein